MNGEKMRVIVCGSTFGQFYFEALKTLSSHFEIVGLLANGSDRSKKCAENYGVNLYTKVNQIPKNVDLACVVLRSGVLGGMGTNISVELLNRGINVIQEQPIHNRDISECLRAASQNNVVFMTGDLYINLPSVKQFITCAKAITARQELLYIDVAFASQVSYPMIHILMEALPSIRNLKIDNVSKSKSPFQVITGEIGDIPFTFRVHNEVNPDDPDNYMHLLHRIEIGCDGGSLLLSDTHGPLLWHPRMHVPKDSITLKDFADKGTSEFLEKTTEILGITKIENYRDIFTKRWPEAIAEDLLVIKEMILGNLNVNMHGQRELLCSNQWHNITKRLGYPTLKSASKHNIFPVSILKTAILEDSYEISSNNINYKFPYKIPRDIQSCSEYGKSELGNIDAESVRLYNENLNEAVLTSMLYSLQIKGALVNKEQKYSKREILNISNTAAEHESLIIKWLELLKKNKYIKCDDELYYGADLISGIKLNKCWDKVRNIWESGFGSKETMDYFIRNVRKLPQLMSGEQKAVFLLFPEGKFDCAYSMYHDMVTVRYLNKILSEAVIRISAEKKISIGSESKGELKIVEIGAGTGATTDGVVKRLIEIEKIINIKYLFTDISNYFLSAAKQKFGNNPWMEFKTINIDKNFITQGLTPKSTDIIIAAGVINNAFDTDSVIKGLMELLVPGGWILITEAVHECMEMLISQGFMMTDPKDDRSNTRTTFMTIDQWEEVFYNAGAEKVLILPEDDHILSPLGQRLFAVKKENKRGSV
ncbi:Thiazolinyl imide reductase [human gut metagenome]|uniref:Thiazolinyl imide reductase n=2 Tax=root TaxID=1 RepID=C4IC02_CLOBU|nr:MULTISPECIES: bifunctional Gfo/Idh/MocA family oxidoreductase/class I SAM-dependent methyltransferase [Clostridium]APF21029.1 thiazolinyl imide reductase family protein [Clostridium butyricum]EDT73777.1 putative thiazolinyl imide reductase subfamily [Clostridium butyricum 5521]EEP56245.1 thiazolinyl imide reductase [Clostridium butyricum E4 str. BoNT E BL5262]MDU1603070.1 bifunctional Gfo/Idh/MocA family oxidoreductase/class I SAM-dependent methyltransferase [Clostridium sp.]NFL30136.1 meth